MEPLETSFIPKEGVGIADKVRKASRKPGGIAGMLALFFFIFSLALFVALIIYEQILVQENEGLRASIETEQRAFDTEDLERIKTADRRITAARDLLGNHRGLGFITRTLEQITLADVQYSGLAFSEISGEGVAASLEGEARNFPLLLEQAQKLQEDGLISDFELQDFSRTDIGNVTFSLTLMFAEDQLLFQNNHTKRLRY